MKYRIQEKCQLAENQVMSFITRRVGTLSISGRRVRVTWPDGSVGHWCQSNEGDWSTQNRQVLFNFFLKNEHLLDLKDNEVLSTLGTVMVFSIVAGRVHINGREFDPSGFVTQKSLAKIQRELLSSRITFDDVTITGTLHTHGVTLSFSNSDFVVEWTPEKGLGLAGPETPRQTQLREFAEKSWASSSFSKSRVRVRVGPDGALEGYFLKDHAFLANVKPLTEIGTLILDQSA